jgi:LmbE family N-acetylglucosaminyl deacetylase
MLLLRRMSIPSATAQDFLRALDETAPAALDARDVAVVVAHPDDETIGCGAQLARLRGASVLTVTDGAPPNGRDAQRCGFAGPDAYAAERARELRHALALAHVAHENLVMLGFSDQTAAMRLIGLTREIAAHLAARDIRTVLTHAYEGGHPDHDATAFAVNAAARLTDRAGHPVHVIEMPFYRGNGDWIVQQFNPLPGYPETAIALSARARRKKRRMIDAYATQRETLKPFDTAVERFRRAPDYDFAALPNQGRLLYERYDWGMTGPKWVALARDAWRALGLGV